MLRLIAHERICPDAQNGNATPRPTQRQGQRRGRHKASTGQHNDSGSHPKAAAKVSLRISPLSAPERAKRKAASALEECNDGEEDVPDWRRKSAPEKWRELAKPAPMLLTASAALKEGPLAMHDGVADPAVLRSPDILLRRTIGRWVDSLGLKYEVSLDDCREGYCVVMAEGGASRPGDIYLEHDGDYWRVLWSQPDSYWRILEVPPFEDCEEPASLLWVAGRSRIHWRRLRVVLPGHPPSPPTLPPGNMAALKLCVEQIEAADLDNRDVISCMSYCFDWLRTGKCAFGRCPYKHGHSDEMFSWRHFGIDDEFKQTANFVLAELSSYVSDKCCFVLDGKSGATSRALCRTRELILAPNVDHEAVAALRASCLAVCCSSTFALEQAAASGARFGCVYLDYMWPLDYFERECNALKRIQLSDIDGERRAAIGEVLSVGMENLDGLVDIARLLGADSEGDALLSPNGAVLAITVVSDKQSKFEKQKEKLEALLCEKGSCLGRTVDRIGSCKSRERPVRTLFYAIGLPKLGGIHYPLKSSSVLELKAARLVG
eukprot:gnl/TRDRNA2_/TRDRNA2_125889_c0_seq2.p1 gnl/TRDRNA2_/TRDRNA2_125889_c0~~gnl/TRDRNA2_/TRDRNA2_125889_c0_seq2.p1  ORF type:complete len:548 (-),score=76.08 gnl/TRDRNA2_/TRDRNA2_125889_c0_seq2:95-1738(-)